jgi:RNA methyltransferase, TrmH family
MPVRIVQSKQNARLKELRRALAGPWHDKAREGAREPGAVAGIEGPNLIAEALRAGLRIESVFVADQSVRLLEGLSLTPEIEVLLLPRELLASALTTETPQPIAALVERPQWSWEQVLQAKAAPLILIVAGLQDPGNLGTILRSAEAFGATGVVSLPGTVSAWNPKAVRASAGSVFRVPLLAAGVEECFARLHAAKIPVWTTAVEDAKEAPRLSLAGPVAVIIGNEGSGVAAEIAEQADGALTIPCPGPVESLNAAVAASVLLYEASRQRAASPQPRRPGRGR